jgi:hypothetical protein
LEITQIVAAAVIDWDDVVDREILLGVAALTLVIVAIEDIVPNRIGEFAAWGFVGSHEFSRKVSREGSLISLKSSSSSGINSTSIEPI